MKYFLLRHKILIPPVVTLAIYLVIFSIGKNVLESEYVEIGEKGKSEEVENVEIVRVYLNVVPASTSYSAKLENAKKFGDFLEYLRKNHGLVYEKVEYTYGTEYTVVDGISAEVGYRWKIYENGEDITYKTSGRKLIKNATYSFDIE